MCIRDRINDIRLQAIGGLICGLDLFNMAVIPMVLYNSEVFTEMRKESLDELEQLQTQFLSVLLAVPISCPRPALAWDTGSLLMENRIMERKLNFVVHLKRLDESALAKQIYEEQVDNEWPGLTQEAKELCKELLLPNLTKKSIVIDKSGKKQWKKSIKNAVQVKNEVDLREKMEGYSKLMEMKKEEYVLKPYIEEMRMVDARLHFRMRTRMLKFKMNQPSDSHNKASLWQCTGCGNVESQSHIL